MMIRRRPSLIIPVEEQVRELDAKVLLAVRAASRGFNVYIGRRDKIEMGLYKFGYGIYLAMDIRTPKIFAFGRKLGNRVVVMDEEAAVHYPDFIYKKRRIVDDAVHHISAFIAWGKDNVELWTGIPKIGRNYDIFVTGSPRVDLLRPELRPYFKAQADAIKDRYGEYILVNTNFGLVINENPLLNLFYSDSEFSDNIKPGKTSVGMPHEYAWGLWNHKRKLCEAFQVMLPELARVFPEQQIIVRPHPMENREPYLKFAEKMKNLEVVHEGNVIPWLMNAKVLLHNGCTTGLEAYLLERPVIAYQPVIEAQYDNELPNTLSLSCPDIPTLIKTIGEILNGEMGTFNNENLDQFAEHFVTARSGRLAMDRMIDAFEDILNRASNKVPLSDRLYAGLMMKRWVRQRSKRLQGNLRTHKFRFSRLDLLTVKWRLDMFQELTGDKTKIAVHQLDENLFRLCASRPRQDTQPAEVYVRNSRQVKRIEYAINGLLKNPVKQLRLIGTIANHTINFNHFVFAKGQLPEPFKEEDPSTAGPMASWQRTKPANFKTAHVARVKNGYANMIGQVFSNSANLIHGCTHKLYFKGKYPTWRSKFKKKKSQLLIPEISYYSEPVAVATASTHGFYFHWLFDVLPRLELLRIHVGDPPQLLYISLNKRFQADSFELMGFKDVEVINPVIEPFICSDELVIPCHQVVSGHEVPKWVSRFLRRVFYPMASPNPGRSKRRIYVSRANASHRRVLNEEDLVETLSKSGFEILKPESLPLGEQVAAFRDADVIVAPHGGGLANLVFASPGAKVVELFPKINVDLYYRVAKSVGLNYYYVKSRYGNPKKLDLSDYFISERDVIKTLMLAGVAI